MWGSLECSLEGSVEGSLEDSLEGSLEGSLGVSLDNIRLFFGPSGPSAFKGPLVYIYN